MYNQPPWYNWYLPYYLFHNSKYNEINGVDVIIFV